MINIGIGISWVKALYSVAANIVANFRARVAADNGIFEAAPCLDVTLDELNAIGLLDKASLITTPNAYKESKLYSVVPVPTLGVEKSTNGSFTTDTDWNKGTGWTIAGGRLVATAVTTASACYQTATIEAGKIYKVVFEITDYTSGGVALRVGTNSAITYFSGVGVYTNYIYVVSGSALQLRFNTNNTSTLSIDNVSVKEYTSGDMTVVRATTATRVNENGLIEVVPKNLVGYSEQFDNAYWVKQELTLIANSIISPDGTLNAYKIIPTTVNSPHQLNKLSISASVLNTSSFYAKKGGYDLIESLDGASGYHGSKFNLNTGTFTNQGTGIGSMTSVGNGWYRCTVTVVTTGLRFYINNSSSYIGDGTSGIYLWGAQLEQGSTATSYFPTTTRLNIPRIDYTSGEGAILVEGQRTNLALYSEQFDNAAWTKTATTISANTTTSPDGTTNADKLVEETTTNVHRIIEFAGGSGVNTYSYSIFAKNFSGNRYLQLWVGNAINGAIYSRFDLQNGTVTQDTTLSGTGYSVGVSSIQNFGNGWYRCTIVGTKTNTTGTNTISVRLSQISTGVESDIYLGDGTSGVYLWGAQLEAGSYATSYIPTVASSVTRNADVISKTGISSLIGQTEGTIFVEVQITDGKINTSSDDLRIIELASSNGLTAINLQLQDTNVLRFVRVSSTQSANTVIADSALTTGGTFKMAAAYKNSDLAFYINGEQIGTSSETFTLESVTDMFIGASKTNSLQIGDSIKQVVLFKERLSNTELATLTTI